ncbi:MAG: glycosyltransferase family 1 protein [Chloroflexota bacterium]
MLIGIDASRAAKAVRTGTEAYAFYLIRHLVPLLVENGHQLRLYYNGLPEVSLFDEPFDQRNRVGHMIIPFPRLWTHVRLAFELAQSPPDLFFTPAHVIPFSWMGKSVATIHDLGYEHFPEAHTAQQVAQLRWSTRHNARRSQVILADSKATQNDLIQRYGTPTAKIRVVYPGLEVPLQWKETPPKPNDITEKPYLLFLSTLQPRKNLSGIITAFQSIAAQIPHDLVLAGRSGWHADQIFAQIEQLPAKIRERVMLPGYIDEERKHQLLKHADIFLYPSLYEGFGFPLLEANAAGLPVITAASSSLLELAETGGAITVDPHESQQIAEAILMILRDPAKRADLIRRGYENIRRFRWEAAAQQTADIFETIGNP